MAWELTGNTNTNETLNYIGTADNRGLAIRTNNKEAVHVDAVGNVGIGQHTPQNMLHIGPGASTIAASRVGAVVASTNPDAGIAIAQTSGVNVLLQASTAGGYIGTTSNHPLVLRTHDLDRVVVDVAGNLHIGPGSTAIAASRVNVVVASTNPDAGIAIAQNSGVNVLLQGSTAGGYIGTTSNHPLILRTNDLDRVVVDVHGKMSISTPAQGSLLEVTNSLGDAISVSVAAQGATGVRSVSATWEAVHAETHSPNTAAVAGYSLNPTGTGAGLYGDSKGNGPGVVGERQF